MASRSNLLETLLQQINPIVGIIGLGTTLSGVAAYWAADSALVGGIAALLVLLLASNLTLRRSARSHKPAYGGSETHGQRFPRQLIHAGSGIIGLIGLTLIMVFSYEPWAIRAQFLVRGCGALSNGELWIAGDGRTDIPIRLKVADCYDKQHRTADHLKTLQSLLDDKQALSTLDPTTVPELKRSLNANIGLDLMMSNESALQTDYRKAKKHLEGAASLRKDDWFVSDLRAAAAGRAEAGRPEAEADVRQMLAKAQAIFYSMPGHLVSANRAIHAHWRGRALASVGAHAEAEREFATELSLMPQGDPQAP